MTVERALHLLTEVGNTNTKLILIVGSRGAGKSKFLRECSMKLGINHLNVSYELGRQLGFTSCSERSFLVGDMLRDMAEKNGRNVVVGSSWPPVKVFRSRSTRSGRS